MGSRIGTIKGSIRYIVVLLIRGCAMSSRWSFYSFSKPRWDAIFGGGLQGAEDEIVQSATWDRSAGNDEQVSIRLAQTIVRRGISYRGLSAAEADELDAIIAGFFCPEGLEDLLGYDYESPDGLSMVVVDALVDRSAQSLETPSQGSQFVDEKPTASPSLLQYLKVGRRHNGAGAEVPDEKLRRAVQRLADTPDRAAAERRVKLELERMPNPSNRYLILDSEEIFRFHDQVTWVINRPLPWPHSACEATARQCLLDVLASAQKKGRWLAGRFS
jgi:hypothetical protein